MRNVFLILLLNTSILQGQQIPDTAYRFDIAKPMYEPGSGSVVMIDAAHHNFHTLNNRYGPFGNVLRADGYQLISNERTFDPGVLSQCKIMVVANALDSSNVAHGGCRLSRLSMEAKLQLSTSG
jgi:hypothetical protein